MSITAADQLDWRWTKDGRSLHLGGKGPALARIVPDQATGLWRISHGGNLSDIVNLSRATDAAISLALASINRQQETPAQPRPCVISAGTDHAALG